MLLFHSSALKCFNPGSSLSSVLFTANIERSWSQTHRRATQRSVTWVFEPSFATKNAVSLQDLVSMAAYAVPTTPGLRPPSDPPSDLPRETALAAAARTTRVITANTAATPGARLLCRIFLPIRTGIVPLLHSVHPAASATTNPVARPAPKTSTSLKNKCVN